MKKIDLISFKFKRYIIFYNFNKIYFIGIYM